MADFRKSRGRRPYGQRDQLKDQYKTNERIRVQEVRVVFDNAEPQVMDTRQALRLAQDQGLDLVEISPKATPPVVKIIDYSKFLYQQKKRQKEQKQNQVKVVLKEIRFGPQTDEHDYDFKLRHAEGFLNEGDKVKAYVFFKGRSILFKEQGELLLLRFANDLEGIAKVDKLPVLEGKRMSIFLSPKKKKVEVKRKISTSANDSQLTREQRKAERQAAKDDALQNEDGENNSEENNSED
ncbi:MAG: translation initiation factor IF-3 [Bacteroidaceae bacterium]